MRHRSNQANLKAETWLMAQRALSVDGRRLALLAVLASAWGCADETAPSDASPPVGGLVACVPEGDQAYPGSGVVRCDAGFLHREQALECRPELARVGSPGYPESRPLNSLCFSDADCRALPDGYCVLL